MIQTMQAVVCLEGLSGVKTIYSTSGAFAALKEDGTVAAWGVQAMEAVVCRGAERRKDHLFYWVCLCCPEGRRHGGSVG